MKNIGYILLTLFLIRCAKEPTFTLEEIALPEVEVIFEPGTITENGGLILNQDLLLDKNMNFAYVHINEFDYDLASTPDGFSYISEIVESRVSQIIYKSFKEDFDFIAVLAPSRIAWPPFFMGTGCAAEGIGCEYFDITLNRLKGYMVFPSDLGFEGGGALHEIAHTWGNKGVIPSTDIFHWGYSNVGGILGGYDEITYLGNKTYQGSFIKDDILFSPYDTYKYGNLELYLMGLIPPEEFEPIIVAENPKPVAIDGTLWGRFTADKLITIQPNEFITKWGERFPSFENSQKKFKMLVVIVSGKNIVEAEKSEEESLDFGRYIEEFSEEGSIENIKDYDKFNFWKATGGRATIETKISTDNITILSQ